MAEEKKVGRLEWELVFDDAGKDWTEETRRARVPGGWLYKHAYWYSDETVTHTMSMVFVPEAPQG